MSREIHDGKISDGKNLSGCLSAINSLSQIDVHKDQVDVIILRDQVNMILNDLSEKERKILEMRHGLNDGITHTLEEVGREFGVTRERIRQIQNLALKKLRRMIEKLESSKTKND